MSQYIDQVAERIRQSLEPSDRPEGGEKLYRLYALLALAKGLDTTAEDVHNAWSIWMLEKDPEHSSIVPFGQLDSDVQQEDLPFLRAIHDVAKTGL